jgi:hypothetical protein
MSYDTLPGNVGFRPKPKRVRLIAHDTIVAGNVYQVDMSTATEANHGLATTVMDAVLADTIEPQTFFVVAEEAGVAGDSLWFTLEGYVTANMKTGVTGTVKTPLAVDPTNTLLSGMAEGAKCVAFAPVEIASGGSGKVWFKGDGYGVYALAGTA